MSNPIVKQNSVLELVKSLVVIPITVAVVMGLGYGLARVAERKQTQSGQPDIRPTDVAADGSITLPMQFALISGQIVYHHPMLTNWQHLEDAVLWHFPLEAGRYTVELNYACDMANAGSTVQVQMADTALILKVADTGGSAMYKKFLAGEVNLPTSDWCNLRIAATEISHKTVMNLRGVKLIPVKKSE